MTLSQFVEQLFSRLGAQSLKTEVFVLDLSDARWREDGRPVVKATSLKSIEEFQPKFESRMASHPTWVNLSYIGSLDRRAIVTVEFASRQGRTNAAASVNYSGPPKMVTEANGNAGAYLVVEE